MDSLLELKQYIITFLLPGVVNGAKPAQSELARSPLRRVETGRDSSQEPVCVVPVQKTPFLPRSVCLERSVVDGVNHVPEEYRLAFCCGDVCAAA